MDTAAQERILGSLKAKGHTFDSYRDLYDCVYDYIARLDQWSHLPGVPDACYPLDPDEQDFLEVAEVNEVLNDVYAQRYSESTQKTEVVDSKTLEETFIM